MGNNPPNSTRSQKPPNPVNRPPDLSTYSDGYELLFFQNSGFWAINGFPFFFIGYPPDLFDPCFKIKNEKPKAKKKKRSFKVLTLKIMISTKVVNTHTRGYFYIIRETKYFNTVDTNILFQDNCYFLMHIY